MRHILVIVMTNYVSYKSQYCNPIGKGGILHPKQYEVAEHTTLDIGQMRSMAVY